MSVEDLEKAIAALSADERARLHAWFEELMADEWDRQIARDAESGKLDKLAKQALEDVKAGRFRPL